ncbi:hypothetical protein [Desulfocastanea catecholica]
MGKVNFVKEFVEKNYELFQQFLEDTYEIEGTEAEGILDELEMVYDGVAALTAGRKGQAIDRKFNFLAVNSTNGKMFTENEGVVLLAKDDLVPETLAFYLSQVRLFVGETSVEAKGVRLLIDRVNAWRDANVSKCKLPDITGEKEIRAALGEAAEVMYHPV